MIGLVSSFKAASNYIRIFSLKQMMHRLNNVVWNTNRSNLLLSQNFTQHSTQACPNTVLGWLCGHGYNNDILHHISSLPELILQ